MTTNYKPLTAGDVRQPGDEVKLQKGIGRTDSNHHLKDDWQPVSEGLQGVPIDFHHIKTCEYRRPLP